MLLEWSSYYSVFKLKSTSVGNKFQFKQQNEASTTTSMTVFLGAIILAVRLSH